MTSPPETFYFAKATGDAAFLQWLHQRLINQYGENPNTDFVLTVKEFADNLSYFLDIAYNAGYKMGYRAAFHDAQAEALP